MKIQAEVSIYPLREPHLSEAINQFQNELDRCRLTVKTETMSTELVGDSEVLFQCLHDSFKEIAKDHNVVLFCKAWNSCPISIPDAEESDILIEIQKILRGESGAVRIEDPKGLSPRIRDFVALAVAVAHKREASVVETCAQKALGSGAAPENVMQVVYQATQMAELPVESYEEAARRGINAFKASHGGAE